MTIAEEVLATTRGANEARNAAMQFGAMSTYVNGVELMSFYQDNSVLAIFGATFILAGKGL